MKCGTQAALAVGAGYLLGRRRKMRLATMLAVGAATGGMGSLGGKALQRGIKMLGSSESLGKFAPQLGELADTVRGDLIDAGKAAATAAVSNRIESLTDSLHERAEVVRDPGAAAGRAGKAAGSGAEEAGRRLGREVHGMAQDVKTGHGSGNAPMDRFKTEASGSLTALGDRAMSSVRDKMEGATGRLTEYLDGGAGPGLFAAVPGAKDAADG